MFSFLSHKLHRQKYTIFLQAFATKNRNIWTVTNRVRQEWGFSKHGSDGFPDKKIFITIKDRRETTILFWRQMAMMTFCLLKSGSNWNNNLKCKLSIDRYLKNIYILQTSTVLTVTSRWTRLYENKEQKVKSMSVSSYPYVSDSTVQYTQFWKEMVKYNAKTSFKIKTKW